MPKPKFQLGRLYVKVSYRDPGEGADLCLFAEGRHEPVAVLLEGAEVGEEIARRANIALGLKDVRSLILRLDQPNTDPDEYE